MGAELAAQVGRGLVEGIESKLQEEPEALGAGLRRPLLAVAGVGSALVALTLLSVRWRRA